MNKKELYVSPNATIFQMVHPLNLLYTFSNDAGLGDQFDDGGELPDVIDNDNWYKAN